MNTLEAMEGAVAAMFEEGKVTNAGDVRRRVKQQAVDEMMACRDLGLAWNDRLRSFEARREAAEELGFRPVAVADAVKELMGEPHDETRPHDERHDHAWFYDHTEAEDKRETRDSSWGSNPVIYVRRGARRTLYERAKGPLSRLLKREGEPKWECMFSTPKHLRVKIPYGVILRMREATKLGLFNCFSALAPIEMFQEKPCPEPDPIIFASMFQITEKPAGPLMTRTQKSAGEVKHFFLAKWLVKDGPEGLGGGE